MNITMSKVAKIGLVEKAEVSYCVPQKGSRYAIE
jgi:hypothetical protein